MGWLAGWEQEQELGPGLVPQRLVGCRGPVRLVLDWLEPKVQQRCRVLALVPEVPLVLVAPESPAGSVDLPQGLVAVLAAA